MRHVITISEDGTITSLGNPLGLPVKESKRWSHIKPVNPMLLLMFVTVRYLFGDKGRMAEWTRGWKCYWELSIPSQHYTGRSYCRQDLIDWEHRQYYMGEMFE